MNPTYIARCAQLAMLLEVSATPKPGNVDRNHDFDDVKYEHFLASAVGAGPIFERAAIAKKGTGSFIRESVEESIKWQSGGNTHFGAFLLLLPLVMAAGNDGVKSITKVVQDTSVEDAVEFYKAFRCVKVRVSSVKELSIDDPNSVNEIKRRGLTLYDLMKLSAKYDAIAHEWVSGFQRTFRGASVLEGKLGQMSTNNAIVFTYLTLLSEQPDTLIQSKFGGEKAIKVSDKASRLIGNWDLDAIHDFDGELIREGINPGSTADMVIGSLFIALLGGMKP
ncbi:MAG TPA: triphosphoribosyl-dephospho-CoA synthase [Methanocellales archaeon]|nr:triphosphoribosyl-dephospho-CoA synthase [Methanocellales archaeon]